MRVYYNDGGASQDISGVENVVNFLVFHQAVRVDTRAGSVERPTDKRRAGRNFKVLLLLKMTRDIGNYPQVHTAVIPFELAVFDDHGFQRRIAGTFTDTQHGGVDRGAAVQPCRHRIGNRIVKIVMPMPFELAAGYAGVVGQPVHDLLDAAGQHDAGD